MNAIKTRYRFFLSINLSLWFPSSSFPAEVAAPAPESAIGRRYLVDIWSHSTL
ncbi:hypothetical protein Hanom_Chr02g00123771 [Helianthus anomalus]